MEHDLDNTNWLAIVQPGTKGAAFCCMFYCVIYEIVWIRQIFIGNMTNNSEPTITKCT